MPEKKFVGHISYEVRNIAAFKFHKIDLRSGQVTEVSGGNGRGKTTLLTGLKSTVTGKPVAFPDWFVRDFEERGMVQANFDDLVTVQRDIKSGETASNLTLCNEHGEPLNGGKRQMESLRALFGDGSYLNPVEIVAMRPGDRTKAIASALDIDPRAAAEALTAITGRVYEITSREAIFPEIQQAHDSLYELRRQKRSDYEDADAQAEGVLAYVPAEWQDTKGAVLSPIEPPALGDVYDKKRVAEVRNAEREQLAREIAELEEHIRRGDEQTAAHEIRLNERQGELLTLGVSEDEEALQEQIRQLQIQLSSMQERNRQRRELSGSIKNAQETIGNNKSTIDGFKTRLTTRQARERDLGGMEDVTALQATIDAHSDQVEVWKRAVQEHGEERIRYEQSEQLRAKAETLFAEWEGLEKKVRRIDHLPVELLEGVKLPIPGMLIVVSDDHKDADIYLPDGEGENTILRKFDAFGDADKYRFAARLAMELSPVNLLILDGVERCDEDRRLELYRMAAEANFVTFSTLVTRGPLQVNHYTAEELAVRVGEEADTLQVSMDLPE